jgi:peptidoglycan-associated lipoprotein
MVVKLSSFTDCRASEEYNQILSEKRAKSSVKYIQQRITKPSRISGVGYGEKQNSTACPCENDAISHCTEEEYQNARSTTFIIVKK